MNRPNSPVRHLLEGLQNSATVILILVIAGILAWFGERYAATTDWTHASRHSLSETSLQILAGMDGSLEITAYARDQKELRARIRGLFDRYASHKVDMHLSFINPDTAPGLVREQGITVDGELLLRFAGKTEHLKHYSEQAFSNALLRLARSEDRWIVFLTGHGERSPFGKANHDLGQWVTNLSSRGFRIQSLDLGKAGTVPDNTTVLVIANPLVALQPGEVDLLRQYLKRGGSLLWMLEPGEPGSLAPLAADIGLKQIPGTIADPTTRAYGVNHATMSIITAYADHPATSGFKYVTIYPEAGGLLVDAGDDWRVTPLFQTAAEAWSEGGELQGQISNDGDNDIKGPLILAYAMERPAPQGTAQQRLVLIGDGDFLANAYLGNSGNQDLGYRLLNWLSSDDRFIDIPTRTANDVDLVLSKTDSVIIGLGFLLGLPLALLITGLRVWLRRRRG